MEWRKNAIDLSGVVLPSCVDRMKQFCADVKDQDFVDMDKWGNNGQLIVTGGVDWHVDLDFGPLTAMVIIENGKLEIKEWGYGSFIPDGVLS